MLPKDICLKWGLFLWYGEDTTGFRIFLIKKGKVQIHRDVIFLPDQKPVLTDLNTTHSMEDDHQEEQNVTESAVFKVVSKENNVEMDHNDMNDNSIDVI